MSLQSGVYVATADLIRAARNDNMMVIPTPEPWHPATVYIRPMTETEQFIFRKFTNGQ